MIGLASASVHWLKRVALLRLASQKSIGSEGRIFSDGAQKRSVYVIAPYGVFRSVAVTIAETNTFGVIRKSLQQQLERCDGCRRVPLMVLGHGLIPIAV